MPFSGAPRHLDRPARISGVDWSHPLARGLSAVALPVEGGIRTFSRTWARPFVHSTYPTALTTVRRRFGPATEVVSGGTTTAYFRLGEPDLARDAWSPPTGQATWFCLLERHGDNANGNAFIFGNSSPSTPPYYSYGFADAGGAGNLSIACNDGAALHEVAQTSGLPNRVPLFLVGTYNGIDLVGYKNGARLPNAVYAPGSIAYFDGVTYPRGPALGNFYNFTGGPRSFVGNIYLAGVFDYGMDDAAVREFSANPWQLFRANEGSTFYSLPELVKPRVVTRPRTDSRAIGVFDARKHMVDQSPSRLIGNADMSGTYFTSNKYGRAAYASAQNAGAIRFPNKLGGGKKFSVVWRGRMVTRALGVFILGQYDQSGLNYDWGFYLQGAGNLYFYQHPNFYASSNFQVVDGQYLTVVGRADGDFVDLWVDGQLVGTQTGGGGVQHTGSYPLRIGGTWIGQTGNATETNFFALLDYVIPNPAEVSRDPMLVLGSARDVFFPSPQPVKPWVVPKAKGVATRHRETPQLDWSNPLLRGAEVVFVGGTPWNRGGDLIRKYVMTVEGSGVVTVPTTGGLATYVNDSNSIKFYVPSGNINALTGWTHAAVLVPLEAPPSQEVRYVGFNQGDSAYDRSISVRPDGSWAAYTYDGAEKFATSTAKAEVGKLAVVVTAANQSSMYCKVAGAVEAVQSVTSEGYPAYQDPLYFTLGNASGGGTATTGVAALLVIRANRCWTKAERESFAANPWQIFREQRTTFSPQIETLKVPTIITRKRTTQPRDVPVVDKSNPLARGLLAHFHIPTLLCAGLVNKLGAYPPQASLGRSGRCLVYNGGQYNVLSVDKAWYDGLITPNGCTAAVLFDVGALENYSLLFAMHASNGALDNPLELRLGKGATDARLTAVRATSGSNQYRSYEASGTDLYAAGDKSQLLVVTFADNLIETSPYFWAKGVKYTGTDYSPGSATGAATTTYGVTHLGGRWDNVARFNGSLYGIWWWNRPLPDHEVRALYENPWQMFRSPQSFSFNERLAQLAAQYPTLSLAELIDLLQTSARPRVQVTV